MEPNGPKPIRIHFVPNNHLDGDPPLYNTSMGPPPWNSPKDLWWDSMTAWIWESPTTFPRRPCVVVAVPWPYRITYADVSFVYVMTHFLPMLEGSALTGGCSWRRLENPPDPHTLFWLTPMVSAFTALIQRYDIWYWRVIFNNTSCYIFHFCLTFVNDDHALFGSKSARCFIVLWTLADLLMLAREMLLLFLHLRCLPVMSKHVVSPLFCNNKWLEPSPVWNGQ